MSMTAGPRGTAPRPLRTTGSATPREAPGEQRTMATYAIVKTGGKQYKVAVGDVVKVEKLDGEPGASSFAARRPGRRRRERHQRRQGAGEGRRHRRGARAHQGPEDPHPQVQEQDRLSQAAGSPSTADGPQGHRHQVGERTDGTQEGRFQLTQRSRLRRPAARRQALRRPGRQGRRDHRPAARHPLPPGRQRRPWRRRHAVRQGSPAPSSSASSVDARRSASCEPSASEA